MFIGFLVGVQKSISQKVFSVNSLMGFTLLFLLGNQRLWKFCWINPFRGKIQ